VDRRRLGDTGIELSALGFGAFKIGRSQGTKYARPYDLPGDRSVLALLRSLAEMGINHIDTAPAYGTSEERLGRLLGAASADFVISTKVGETFDERGSHFDFSANAVRRSIETSLRRLRRGELDMVFVHSNGDDLTVLRETDVVAALTELRTRGLVRAIGFSGKTVEGARESLAWADVLMVEYHMDDVSHDAVMGEAHRRGVGVVVKKGLASGRLPAAEAVPFVLGHPAVTNLVVGGLSVEHLRANAAAAEAAR
jgi:aryl-alcohol dehydrogenase-like predicted oxidoreductase